jgi:hypothetical protein
MNEDKSERTTEVRETGELRDGATVRRQTVSTSEKVGGGVIAARVVYYLTGVIVALLALRVVLLLLAANQGSAFVDFVYGLSGIFAWPFYGIFSYVPAYGQSVFEISSIVAIIVYILAGMGLAKLFTLTSKRDVA